MFLRSGDEQAVHAGDIKWRQAGVKYDKVGPLGTSEERTLQCLLLSNGTIQSQWLTFYTHITREKVIPITNDKFSKCRQTKNGK